MLAALADSANGNVKVIAEVKRRSPSKGWLHESLDVAQTRACTPTGERPPSRLDRRRALRRFPRGSRRGATRREPAATAQRLHGQRQRRPRRRRRGGECRSLDRAALSDEELEEFIAVTHDAGLDALVEVHDGDEAKRALDCGARIVGVNQRNLHTFEVDRDNAARVMASLPTSVVTVCESGLGSADDVARAADAGFDAVLVGEAFVTAPDIAQTVRAFSSVPTVKRD